MILEIVIVCITTFLVYVVYKHKKNHNYFKTHGVKFVPGLPIFGNTLKSTFLKQHVFHDVDAVYKAFPNEKYVGYLEGVDPIILIKDPDIIKQVTIKDFDHFTDHRQFFEDPLFNSSLFMMKGERWHNMRTTLSPAFTGSKMRQMVPFMIETSNNIVEYLKENKSVETDVDAMCRYYTSDIIASAAFGLQVNSLKDPENEFYVTGQRLVNFSGWQRFKIFMTIMFPILGKFVAVFPPKTSNFFRNIVKNTMDYREKNNVERPDMIQLLLEASKGTLRANPQEKQDSAGFATTEEILESKQTDSKRWTIDELSAQAFIFFFAGFESSASMIVMALHELALSPNVQKKLYDEVITYHEKHEKISYEGIQQLKYLDSVLNETFRKWSPAIILDRVCLKTYTLPAPREGGDPLQIKPGQTIYNCVNSMQLDEKFYPNSQKFDPERFSDENIHNIKPFTFLPFGSGPRNCIASRFALLEIKVLLYHLILNFEVLKTSKTVDPIILKPSDFPIKCAGGTWVKFESRN